MVVSREGVRELLPAVYLGREWNAALAPVGRAGSAAEHSGSASIQELLCLFLFSCPTVLLPFFFFKLLEVEPQSFLAQLEGEGCEGKQLSNFYSLSLN